MVIFCKLDDWSFENLDFCNQGFRLGYKDWREVLNLQDEVKFESLPTYKTRLLGYVLYKTFMNLRGRKFISA